MKNLRRIPINIWDDYGLDTHAFVEDTSIPLDNTKEILDIVINFANQLNLVDIKMWIELDDPLGKFAKNNPNADLADPLYAKIFPPKWKLNFENLTDAKRDKLLNELNLAGLSYNNIPFEFYSES
jgi:hypothetical protein